MKRVALYGLALILIGGMSACSFQKKGDVGSEAPEAAPTTEAPAALEAPAVPAPEEGAPAPAEPAPEAPAENP